MTAGEWCSYCGHLIVQLPSNGPWVHFSDDDWSGDACRCVLALRSCQPQSFLRKTIFLLPHGS